MLTIKNKRVGYCNLAKKFTSAFDSRLVLSFPMDVSATNKLGSVTH